MNGSVNMLPGERKILFVVFRQYGHTFQLIWEPGFESSIEGVLEAWVQDDELAFTVDDMVTMVEAAIVICRNHNHDILQAMLDDDFDDYTDDDDTEGINL